MAEALLREYAGDRFDVYSAGTEPADAVHPLATQVMAEKGIDMSGQRPKGVGTYLGKLPVRYLIIVCHDAEKNCPRIFPGMMSRSFWPLDDPAAFVGSPEATVEKFRDTRDQITLRIKTWLMENP